MWNIKNYIFLLCIGISTLQAQNVTTFINAGSGIDESLFLSSSQQLYGNGWIQGRLFEFSSGSPVLVKDSMVNGTDVCENSQGDIFFCDHGASRIYRLDTASGISTVFDSTIVTPAGLIKMPGSDTLLVASVNSQMVYKLAPDGNTQAFITGAMMNSPVTFSYDASGNLYIGNYNNGKIIKRDVNGVLTELADLPTNSLGHFALIDNSLFVTGVTTNVIYEVDITTGTYSVFAGTGVAGSTDGPLSSATFDWPNGIEASISGDSLYVSDYNTSAVRLITGVRNYMSESPMESQAVFSIYPIPSNGAYNVSVSLAEKEDLSISLCDLQGRELNILYNATTTSGEHIFHFKTDLQGLYLLKIEVSGKAKYQKMILQ